MTVAARLRRQAAEYELNKLAAEERNDSAAPLFAAIAVSLYEVAQALEEEYEECAT